MAFRCMVELEEGSRFHELDESFSEVWGAIRQIRSVHLCAMWFKRKIHRTPRSYT